MVFFVKLHRFDWNTVLFAEQSKSSTLLKEYAAKIARFFTRASFFTKQNSLFEDQDAD